KSKHFVIGICPLGLELIEASAWTWARVSRPKPGAPLRLIAFQGFGEHPERFRATLDTNWAQLNPISNYPPPHLMSFGPGRSPHPLSFNADSKRHCDNFVFSLMPLTLSEISVIAFSRSTSAAFHPKRTSDCRNYRY